MRYIIDVSPETDAHIRQLISDNKYLTVYQFVSRAIEEMLHIEHEEINDREEKLERKESIDQAIRAQYELLKQPELDPENLAVAHKMSELFGKEGNEVPWLWGQINSVLCIKFVLRMLAAMTERKQDESIALSDASSIIADTAIAFNRNLTEIDKKQQRPRDAKFSLSFPKNTEKSRERFISQYLGYLDSKNCPRGALVWLGFARISGKRGAEKVALTPAGFHFGKMTNQMIDLCQTDEIPEEAFAEDEIQFYTAHILKHAPCEANAMQTVCSLIDEGENTPQTLDSALRVILPKWSDAEVVTYKGGTLARLYQLGLIAKNKKDDGTISYELTGRTKFNGLI